jgi:hypothetical protein
VVSFTPWLLCSSEEIVPNTLWIGGWGGGLTAFLEALGQKIIFFPAGNRTKIPRSRAVSYCVGVAYKHCVYTACWMRHVPLLLWAWTGPVSFWRHSHTHTLSHDVTLACGQPLQRLPTPNPLMAGQLHGASHLKLRSNTDDYIMFRHRACRFWFMFFDPFLVDCHYERH